MQPGSQSKRRAALVRREPQGLRMPGQAVTCPPGFASHKRCLTVSPGRTAVEKRVDQETVDRRAGHKSYQLGERCASVAGDRGGGFPPGAPPPSHDPTRSTGHCPPRGGPEPEEPSPWLLLLLSHDLGFRDRPPRDLR